MIRKLIFVLIICSGMAHAQSTWIAVAGEGDVVTSKTAITYRFGNAPDGNYCKTAGGCWTTPVTTTVLPVTVAVQYQILGDPAPGLSKVLQVAETSVAQTVVDTPSGGKGTPIAIPALTVSPPVVTPPAATNSISFTFSGLVNGAKFTATCTAVPVSQ